MLNQERVCEMTKLAIFDQKKGREYKPMTEYFRRDYIARELLKSFITEIGRASCRERVRL